MALLGVAPIVLLAALLAGQAGALRHEQNLYDQVRTTDKLHCCCRPGNGCYYVAQTKCPSRTRSARKSEINTCILDKNTKIEPPKQSKQRAQCAVASSLDSKIFPVGTGAALRQAVANLPGIGDLYLRIHQIHITEVNLWLNLKRKDDHTFTFKVTGPGGKGHAKVRAWLEGLEVVTPDSKLDTFADVVSKFENVGVWLLTAGYAKNYGRMDMAPVDIDLSMSGDFRIDGGYWELVPGTEQHHADVKLGSGGLLMGIVNLLIKALGGMDKIFFEQVWPLLREVIPEKVGVAFETVPFKDGELDQNFKVTATCVKPEGRRCPNEELKLDVRQSSSIRMFPKPILKQLSEGGFLEIVPAAKELLADVAGAYNQGSLLNGSAGVFELTAALSHDDGLAVTVSPSVEAPMRLIKTILDPYVNIGDFLPSNGSLFATGGLAMEKGSAVASDMLVENVVLPVSLAEGDDALELNVTLEEFSAELETADADDIVFGKSSPLAVRLPGFQAGLGHESGFSMRMQQRSDLLRASLSPEYIMPLIHDATSNGVQPASVRTGANAEEADAQVPSVFQRPFSRTPRALDLNRLLKAVELKLDLNVDTPKVDVKEEEILTVDTAATLTATLRLGSPFYQGILDASTPDHGYLHFATPGYFGKLPGSKSVPETKAFAWLTCGTLELYEVKPGSKPFDTEPVISLDLRSDDAISLIQSNVDGKRKDVKMNVAKLGSTQHGCLFVGEDQHVFGLFGSTQQFFCAPFDVMELLTQAALLQVKRFQNAAAVWRDACVPGVGGLDVEPVCPGSPDGTWFRRLDPLNATTYFPGRRPPAGPEEVISPQDSWNAARKRFFGK